MQELANFFLKSQMINIWGLGIQEANPEGYARTCVTIYNVTI